MNSGYMKRTLITKHKDVEDYCMKLSELLKVLDEDLLLTIDDKYTSPSCMYIGSVKDLEGATDNIIVDNIKPYDNILEIQVHEA